MFKAFSLYNKQVYTIMSQRGFILCIYIYISKLLRKSLKKWTHIGTREPQIIILFNVDLHKVSWQQ